LIASASREQHQTGTGPQARSAGWKHRSSEILVDDTLARALQSLPHPRPSWHEAGSDRRCGHVSAPHNLFKGALNHSAVGALIERKIRVLALKTISARMRTVPPMPDNT